LGNIEHYQCMGKHDTLQVEAKPERLADMRATVDAMIGAKSCQAGEAASLRGKVLNVSLTRQGRSGRLPTKHLNACAEGFLQGWCQGLQEDLELVKFSLAQVHVRHYPLTRQPVLGPRLWSDASFDQKEGCMRMKMSAIIANASRAIGVVFDADEDLFARLAPRSTQIAAGEMIALMAQFAFFAEELKGNETIAFCDNLGVVFCALKGDSAATDLACMSRALCMRTLELRVTVWFEYVESEANIADGGSRCGVECPVSRDAGIKLREVPCPKLPIAWNHKADWSEFWSR